MMRYLISIIVIVAVLTSCNAPANNATTQAYELPSEILKIPVGNQYGLRAAEIKLPDTEGNTVALSEFNGKLVLVDFWASWCPPCRKENPALIKLYEKYKDTEFVNANGFTIYSVSLDRNKEAWLKAIADDQLPWPVHVSDLLGARTEAARDYGVLAIPSSFLLDQNGVIIGVNLKGEKLADTIAELVEP